MKLKESEARQSGSTMHVVAEKQTWPVIFTPEAAQPLTELVYRHPSIDLPNMELAPFDENPSIYWRFIREFDNFVDCRISNPGQKFLYLKHYCRGKARDAIEECVMLPKELGISRARDILKELFGQPFHVARTLIDWVLAEARKARNEPKSLVQLVMKMQNCFIALTQMSYEADLNALHTLEAVVRFLPADIQQRWAEEAVIIGRSGREPHFT
ncbi:unnamed protein product [Echinostoma caproni]|uniref:BTB domain-containing protein n=1 Tax=Echinostoma caproni TaxID=27848 RepID=A0A183B6Y0_9TREM|nr:unnamed protein product [Echinostoma caproni]